MKNRIAIILFLSLIFISCKNGTGENQNRIDAEIKKNDSIQKQLAAEELLKRKNDSIALIEQSKVIGDITFGISEKEAKTLIKEFIEKSKRTKYSNSDLTYPFIGNYEFSEFGQRGRYHNDKLYMFQIVGEYLQWEDYKTDVPKQVKSVTDVISLKYGKPIINQPIPERYQLEKGFTYLLKSWVVGTKKIEIRLTDKGRYNTVDVYIYQPEVLETVKSEQNKSDKLKSEKDKNVF